MTTTMPPPPPPPPPPSPPEPGDLVRTTFSLSANGEVWTLRMAVDGDASRVSTVVADAPFMGLLDSTTSWREVREGGGILKKERCCTKEQRYVTQRNDALLSSLIGPGKGTIVRGLQRDLLVARHRDDGGRRLRDHDLAGSLARSRPARGALALPRRVSRPLDPPRARAPRARVQRDDCGQLLGELRHGEPELVPAVVARGPHDQRERARRVVERLDDRAGTIETTTTCVCGA